jgi:DNA-binding NarL/FixJ family response regulator
VSKITIIEDNIKLRKQMIRILRSKLPFLSVAEASGEKDALSEISKNRPDLVIVDIRLAGENGLNLTKKIKMQYPFIPVVINTNNDSPDMPIRLLPGEQENLQIFQQVTLKSHKTCQENHNTLKSIIKSDHQGRCT